MHQESVDLAADAYASRPLTRQGSGRMATRGAGTVSRFLCSEENEGGELTIGGIARRLADL